MGDTTDLKVSPDALRQFANSLEYVKANIQSARDHAGDIIRNPLKAGSFPEGQSFVSLVTSTNGRAQQYDSNLQKLYNAVSTLQTDLYTLCNTYTNTEDLNTQLGQQISSIVASIQGQLPSTPTGG